MARDLFSIGVGGALGAVARYGVGLLAGRWFGVSFPFGILAVNVAGCFLIGMLAAVVVRRETEISSALEAAGQVDQLATMVRDDATIRLIRCGLMIGFLGGLTTFSSFGLDTLSLLERNRFDLALANIALNLVTGLAAVWAGLSVVRSIW